MPLISFIIPYYNLPMWMLLECLDSIRSLSLRTHEREIIVVDDGSDISIEKEINDYDPTIIYIRKDNGGPGAARNAGLRVAKGEFVQFVDGDDRLNTVPYEYCLSIHRKHRPDILLFDFDRKENSDTAWSITGPLSGIDHMNTHNIRASVCGYIVRKSIVDGLDFTDEIFHEDEEFTPQLIIRAQTVYTTDAKAYMYRVREGSIMTSNDAKSIRQRQENRLYVLSKLHNKTLTMDEPAKSVMERRVAQLTMDDIYNVIMLGKSYGEVSKRIEALSENGLFPLPDRNYTVKYTWFRRLTKTKVGLRILTLILPMLKRER